MLDNIKTGLSVMGLGMGTTFVVLAVLMAVLMLMGYVAVRIDKSLKTKKAAETPAEDSGALADITPANTGSDGELIAVMAAALAAYSASENVPQSRLVVRSIRRVTNWSKK